VSGPQDHDALLGGPPDEVEARIEAWAAELEPRDPLVLEHVQESDALLLGPPADRGLLLSDGPVLAVGRTPAQGNGYPRAFNLVLPGSVLLGAWHCSPRTPWKAPCPMADGSNTVGGEGLEGNGGRG